MGGIVATLGLSGFRAFTLDSRKGAIREPMWKLLQMEELVKVLIVPNAQVAYLHRRVDAHSVQL